MNGRISKMEAMIYIESFRSYEICKKFHKRVQPLKNYMVRTLGIDEETAGKVKLRTRKGKIVPRLRKSFSILLHTSRLKRRKGRRSKKKKGYELAKSF